MQGSLACLPRGREAPGTCGCRARGGGRCGPPAIQRATAERTGRPCVLTPRRRLGQARGRVGWGRGYRVVEGGRKGKDAVAASLSSDASYSTSVSHSWLLCSDSGCLSLSLSQSLPSCHYLSVYFSIYLFIIYLSTYLLFPPAFLCSKAVLGVFLPLCVSLLGFLTLSPSLYMCLYSIPAIPFQTLSLSSPLCPLQHITFRPASSVSSEIPEPGPWAGSASSACPGSVHKSDIS